MWAYSAFSLNPAQAWSSFFAVYSDLSKLLSKRMRLEQEQGAAVVFPDTDKGGGVFSFADPATDFRVLGVQVFARCVGTTYQKKLWVIPVAHTHDRSTVSLCPFFADVMLFTPSQWIVCGAAQICLSLPPFFSFEFFCDDSISQIRQQLPRFGHCHHGCASVCRCEAK